MDANQQKLRSNCEDFALIKSRVVPTNILKSTVSSVTSMA